MVINVIFDEGLANHAQSLFKEMTARSKNPNAANYNALIKGYYYKVGNTERR